MRVFEGFAGYGGGSFGLRRSGLEYEVIGYSENDPYCCELYEANHPGIPNFGDITKIKAEDLPNFDLFMGGFPCQPFSSAGLGKGELDIRGTLFYDIIRICECKTPDYIFLENVKGLTSNRHRETFSRIQTELRRIGYGDMAYKILNTKDYGIPQNRERLWMFARRGGLPETFNLELPKIELTKFFGDFLDEKPPKELYLSDAQIEHLKVKHNIPNFLVDRPLCFDVYNKKIKQDGLCITLTMPEHNSIRAIEVPRNGREIVRKLSIAEQFRFMGFEDGELNTAGQSYTQLSKRAGNGWDVNLVGRLLKHIFNQIQ